MIESVPKKKKIVLGADLNGHVGEGIIEDEEVMGRYGAGTGNKEGSTVVDFAKRMNLAIVITYFKKKHKHRVTYKSGRKKYPNKLCDVHKEDLKEMCDCQVMVNECVAKQHRMVVCRMSLMKKKEKDRESKAKDKMVETE